MRITYNYLVLEKVDPNKDHDYTYRVIGVIDTGKVEQRNTILKVYPVNDVLVCVQDYTRPMMVAKHYEDLKTQLRFFFHCHTIHETHEK